jgi:ankyrin repeat protein
MRPFLALTLVMAVLECSVIGADLTEQAKRGDFKKLKKTIDADPKLANAQRDDGVPLLYFAAANGHADMVEYLIKMGAAVDAKTEYGGALHVAVEGEHRAAVSVLLKSKADPNLRNKWGQSPLHGTTTHRDEQIAQLLVKAGADVSAVDDRGRTPLHRCKSLPVAKVLVQAGANVNAQDTNGYNALHWAATPREIVNKPTVDFLLARGIDVSAKDKKGLTPLELARHSGQKDIVAILEKQRIKEKVQPDGPANGSQPMRAETNRTSSAAGSRR